MKVPSLERVWKGRDYGHLIDVVTVVTLVTVLFSSIFIAAAVVTALGMDGGLRPEVYDCPRYTLISECGEKVPDTSVSGDVVVGGIVMLTLLTTTFTGYGVTRAVVAFVVWVWPSKVEASE